MPNRNKGKAAHRGGNITKDGAKKDALSYVKVKKLTRSDVRLGRCDILRCENDAFWTDSRLILCDSCAAEAQKP